MFFNNPSDICDYFINNGINEGDSVIDATVGNGNDTLKLSKAVGKTGFVFGFDIQQGAIDSALKKDYPFENVKFYLMSHSEMDSVVNTPVSAVIFNLGYLPGGNHSISTKADTTIPAIEKALELLKPNGFILTVIYSGKDTGFDERNAVLQFFKKLDYKKYNILFFDYINRPNNPPSVCVIQRK